MKNMPNKYKKVVKINGGNEISISLCQNKFTAFYQQIFTKIFWAIKCDFRLLKHHFPDS